MAGHHESDYSLIDLACLNHTCQIYNKYSVTVIEVHDDAVYFYGPFPSSIGCSDSNWIVYNLEKMADRALSIGLTARATNQKVKYYYNDTNKCNGNVIQGYFMSLE